MSKVQQEVGMAFEEELAKILSEHGYWVHRFAHNKNGQPADLIAANKYETLLIDCKHCENNKFPLSHVEPNQKTSMTLWWMLTNTYGYFAMKLTDGIYFIDSGTMFRFIEEGKTSLSYRDIVRYSRLLEDFL